MTEQPKENGLSGSRLEKRGRKSAGRDKRKREKTVMVVMIVAALLMVLAATVTVLYTRWVRKPELPGGNQPAASDAPLGIGQQGDPLESGEVLDLESVQPKVSGERKSKDFYTILIFGADESSGLTDTMMVASYDVTNQRATVMSIPRDILANTRFSGVDAKKMNAVYKFNGKGEKGVEALKNEVSELVGFVPDYYVMIDWAIVGKMVDAIGGVYFEVPWDMWYSDPYQDLYIDLKEGYQLLDGDQAMQLVRWRKNMDPKTFKILSDHSVGDVGRLEIQHNFLKAVLKQALQLKNVTKIGQLAQLFGENVTSDLSIENMFWFASQAIMGGLAVDDVEFVTMPYANGSYPTKSGGEWKNRSFIYPTQKKLLEIINNGLNPYVDDVTVRELDLIYPNSSGGLSATSGKLADPSMAALPEEYLAWKAEQEDPDASQAPEDGDGEPDVSGDPAASQDPASTADPLESQDPADSQQPDGGAEPTETPEPQQTDDPLETMPDWLRPDTGTEIP